MLLETMRQEHVVVRALMNPDEKPYSWFEDGEAKGIVPDIFRRTIEILGLDYEIVETSSRAHYEQVRAAIVPGATLELRMGVSDQDDYRFYGIWEKTLAVVAAQVSAQVVQSHTEGTVIPNFTAYLFDHPEVLFLIVFGALLIVFFILLTVQSVRSKNKQRRIADELAAALEDAKKANRAKQDFFSKMSHDIRTPLNVVLGMTQIAQKYKGDPEKLDSTLDNIRVEGNQLLSLINSILDASQLEHGHVELVNAPFNPVDSVRDCEEMLLPLAALKACGK